MHEKKAIREQMKERLKQLAKDQKEAYDRQIAEHLFALSLWREAKTVGMTISAGHEVNTKPLIEQAWNEGKIVCAPKCHPAFKTMTFRAIRSFGELECVYFGLQEPIEAITREVQAAEIDVMIVPGLCFSQDGYRIGYGGGYYDRYLQHFRNKTVSLAYDFQVVPHLPIEPHDLPVGMIITNEKVIACHE